MSTVGNTLDLAAVRGTIEVLVVDASEGRRLDLQQRLTADGHHVALAASAAEALVCLRGSVPHLVIAEAVLPDLDGFELCRRVRADERLQSVGVILRLSGPRPEDLLTALEAGADSFLLHSARTAAVLDRVRAVRRTREQRSRRGPETTEIVAFGQVRRVVTSPSALAAFLTGACESAAELDALLARVRDDEAAGPLGCPLMEPGAGAVPASAEDPVIAPRCGRHTRGLATQVFESTFDGIVVTDRTGVIVAANPAFCAMTGYERDELLGQNPRIMKSDRHDADFYRLMWQELAATGHWQGEVWDRRKNGDVYPKWMTISAMRSVDGDVTHYVGVSSDITKVKRSEADLERLAHYDALTALPNRVLFRDRLQQAMAQARRQGTMVALLFLDLDGFKNINNTLGHHAGDLLLAAVAERLAACVRGSDTVARLGGDEFSVVLPGLTETSSAALVARKIWDSFGTPFDLDNRQVAVTTSIGIALYPQDGETIEDLLKNADTAMYHAKELGRNGYRFFSGAMHAKALLRLELESDLRRAIDREEFLLHYQPRVDLRTGAMNGVEALVRWQHPTQGMVPPGRFISIAEQTRLILPLGEWVLRTALRQQAAWVAAGLPPLRMAVNLAAPQFEQPDLVRRITNALIAASVPPDHLEIELTESTAMSNPDATASTLLELKAIGVHVSIDDFGTGYSSLGYLKRFPLDALKIDRSFVRDLGSDPDGETIARAIIGLARSLGHTVVAEGVETKEQLRFLIDEGCDEVQGYLLSRPVPADAIEKLLRQKRRLLPA